MSHVDNVLLTWDILERDSARIAEINAWLGTNAREQEFKDISRQYDAYGGEKCLETVLLIAACNFFPEDAFVEFLKTLPWDYPGNVQMIIQRQHDNTFEIVAPFRAGQ